MKQWYAKEFSNLTQVSVRTLHYYDKVGLLKPSLRLANGYRLYSEKDLSLLQQIISLKFFGFKLSQIKKLLTNKVSVLENLSMQSKCLQEQAQMLVEASSILKRLTSECCNDESIPWETMIQFIEVYRMTQQLKHSWVKEIFTPEELKEYVAFETEFRTKSTLEEQAAFENSWAALVEEVRSNLSSDPGSAIGIQIGCKMMQWVNRLYGKKYAHLRTKKFEKGFGEGKGLDEVNLTPEMVSWLDKAMDAYWHQRIYDILAKVGKVPTADVLNLWHEVLDDMYGDQEERKAEIYPVVLADKQVSDSAKQWLKKEFGLK